uniref:Ribonuclease H-like domain-containing protein n=1 Tax=Tanacetum cinerariifolium TaxID=118510 RepID=A0A6L2NGC5_TANCI|nr:ribonuclease H-like domain-containing protein [Tanacetum cinerariifolium]
MAGREHCKVVKRILRYIKGTSDVALCFGDLDLIVKGYVYFDYACDLDEKAEYVAVAQASKEAVWLKMLLEELGRKQKKNTLFCDNQSALYLARDPTFHSKTKHIRVQYHFVREKVEEGIVNMQKIHTDNNVPDYLTKAINGDKFIEVLPYVRSTYATISIKESHRVASGSVSGSSQRNQASAFVSNVPNRGIFQRGHSSNIAPRPNNLIYNRQSKGYGLVCENCLVMNKWLLSYLSSKITKLKRMCMPIWQSKVIVNGTIVDHRANQHMNNSDKELDNVYDISHLKIKVGHPNGTKAFISKIGNLKLPNGLILFDALVILEYCVTLISVHKRAKDPVLNVLKNNLGIENKSQTEFSETCQIAKKTREHFPLSNHTSSKMDFVDLPKHRKAIGSKWIFKIKYKSSGEIDRYKAILVAQGFSQKEGTGYKETCFTVVKMVTIRCLLNVVVSNSWHVFQLDVNNAFFQSKSDYSLYTKFDKGVFLILLVYVDGIIITGNNVSKTENFKVYLKSKSMIKDLGKLIYFLGIEVIDTDKGICLNQRKYVLNLLSNYGMLACKPAKTPLMSKLVIYNEATDVDPILDNVTDYHKLMGKLIYLTNTKPDISYVVHCLSQFMHSPLKSHLKTAFKIFRYLKGCLGLAFIFSKTLDKKQNTLSKSSTEVEYRAFASVTSEVIWVLKNLKDLNIDNLLPVSLHRDSNSAIKLAANLVFYERTKHLEIELHFVREKILSGVVKIVKIDSANQIENILTKGLDTVQHNILVEKLMFDIYRLRLRGVLKDIVLPGAISVFCGFSTAWSRYLAIKNGPRTKMSQNDLLLLTNEKVKAKYSACFVALCFSMSTLVFDDPESFTQADGTQSSRGEARTSESPYIVTPPTCHVEESEGSGTSGARSTSSDSTATLSPDHPLTHTTPVLVLILRRTVRMVMRVSLVMSPGLSAGIAEVATMSDLAFRKRFRSSYDSSPSLTLPVQKRYRGTSELILGTDSEDDEEVEESSNSDSESEDVEDEGPTAEDEDPAAEDEGLATGVDGLDVDDESYGLDDESRVPVVGTAVSEPLGLGYGALRRRELALEEDHVYSAFEPTLTTWTDSEDGMIYIDVPVYPPPAPHIQTPPLPKWTFGSLPISPSPFIVPSPVSSPMIPLTVPSPIATSTATIPVDEE